MKKFDLISWMWPGKKASYSNDDYWEIDVTPSGQEELWHFENPEAYESPADTRDILENHDYARDIEGKRQFRVFVSWVGGAWVALLIALVVSQGADAIPYKLGMEEFIAVVTTTTASIFGIIYVVARYLFGSKAYESKTKSGDSVAPKQ